MKSFLIILSTATVCMAGFEYGPNDRDWKPIQQGMQELSSGVENATAAIRNITWEDNSKLAVKIGQKTVDDEMKLSGILYKGRAEANRRVLTVERLVAITTEGAELLSKIKTDKDPELDQLSAEAKAKIQDILTKALDEFKKKGEEVLALMRAA